MAAERPLTHQQSAVLVGDDGWIGGVVLAFAADLQRRRAFQGGELQVVVRGAALSDLDGEVLGSSVTFSLKLCR